LGNLYTDHPCLDQDQGARNHQLSPLYEPPKAYDCRIWKSYWEIEENQLRHLAGSDGGTRQWIERGLIEDLMDRFQGQPLDSTEGEDLGDGLQRERIWHYPPEALRETIVNALAHRDWIRAFEVEIVADSDRLEVLSPGALQNSMTVEKMLAGQRSPRNTTIVGVLRDYGYVDARGMGMRNKLIPLVRAASGEEPAHGNTNPGAPPMHRPSLTNTLQQSSQSKNFSECPR
jgi:hypothetical protein